MVIAIISIALFLLIVTAIYLFMSAPNKRSRRNSMDICHTDYAHRGLHNEKYPENSIAAYKAAIEAGYGIELDLHLSSDGEVMVFHDDDLSRVCGENVKLSSLTADELKNKKLCGTEYTIPRFSEALSLVEGRVPILIELKGTTSDTRLCEAVAELLEGYNGKYCVQSFNPFLLGWFKKNAPRVTRGLLYTNFFKNSSGKKLNDILLTSMVTNIIARPDFISSDGRFLDLFPVKLMRKLYKLPFFCWTITDNEDFKRFSEEGMRNIFENLIPAKK